MRILMLTEFFPKSERGEITGGVETRCFYVSKRLAQTDEVEVLALRTDGSAWDYASLSSIPRRLAFLSRAFLAGLRADFDIVEGSNQLVHPLAWLLGRIKRRSVIQYYPAVLIGSWTSGFGWAGWLGELAERVSLRLKADHYIAPTQTVAEQLASHDIDPATVSVIPCGVDEELAASVRAEAPARPVTIAVVTRLLPYKSVHVAIEAAAVLTGRGFTITMAVVGQGPELENLRRRAQALGLGSSVNFLGHLPAHRDVLRVIASARVLVSSSTVEGFGIVLAEAMALGVPYVASDIPTHREVTGGGVGGALFRPGDAHDLANRIAELLSDTGAYSTKSEEGIEWAKRYRWADVAAATRGLYRDMLSTPRAQPAHRISQLVTDGLLTRFRMPRRG